MPYLAHYFYPFAANSVFVRVLFWAMIVGDPILFFKAWMFVSTLSCCQAPERCCIGMEPWMEDGIPNFGHGPLRYSIWLYAFGIMPNFRMRGRGRPQLRGAAVALLEPRFRRFCTSEWQNRGERRGG